MQDFVIFCLTPLLSHPDELLVETEADVVKIKVNPEDAGRVIGKGGSVITALRSLLAAFCANHELRPVQVTLVD